MFDRVLFINESPVYGGHEEMFLRHMKEIVKKNTIHLYIIVNAKNKKFIEEIFVLRDLYQVNVDIFAHRFIGFPLRPITNVLAISDFFWLIKKIKEIRPTKVVVIQGTIEIGGLSLIVSRLMGKQTICYLPITKRSKVIGVMLGRLRDFLNKQFYYKLPHKIITISEFNKQELLGDFLVSYKKVNVVKNFITTSEVEYESPIINSSNTLLLIGRIDFNQKRQDLFLEKFVNSDLMKKYEVNIIGDNNEPASNQLRLKFKHFGNIKFLGWLSSKEIASRIIKCNCVIIPSRFEGVPLVMIEAICFGKVVIASNVDGMKEYLPKKWLFDVDTMDDAIRVISELEFNPEEFTENVPQVQLRFKKIFDPKVNSTDFMNAIESE